MPFIAFGRLKSLIYSGRYIILLMGLFSIYTGFMYNDLFSKTLHIWHSAWSFSEANGTVSAVLGDHRYPFGLDPGWHGADNALVFTNSYKMKMSIVLGVIHVCEIQALLIDGGINFQPQMTFALCLQVPNHLKFKRYSDLYTNFIPQIVFLQSIFGYLLVCILYKWSIDWSTSSTQPPSLLNMLISMFLQPGTVDPKTQLYRGQAFVQVVLLGLAAICVPWLLVTKPYLEWRRLNRTQGQGYMTIGHGEGHDDNDGLAPYTPGISLAEEEEGNGGALLAQAADEQEVCVISLRCSV